MFIINSKVLSNSRPTNLLETLKIRRKNVPERHSSAFNDNNKKSTSYYSVLFQLLKQTKQKL
jgi:hypothetical protein